MKRKILHISKMKGVSGSENHLLSLLSGLDASQFDRSLCILTEPRHAPLLQTYRRTLEQAGVHVLLMEVPKYFSCTVAWKLWRYVRREQFDLVHTHLLHADWYGTLAAKLAGVPVILSSRHNDDRFRRYPPFGWINRRIARWHLKVIAISEWVARFLQEVEGIPAEKIVRIHYGIDIAAVSAQADPAYIRQQFRIPDGVPIIGTIGQLRAQKGHAYFLQAVRQIIAQFPQLRVFIIGEGELRAKLEQQIAASGLANNIILTGYRTDALKLLSGFDCFVFPSLWEGLGLVLLEAMALRKAIIASDVSAIPESVIDGQTGILIPPRQPERLADAMLKLLNDSQLRRQMGDAGYAHVQAHFSVKNMLAATAAVYTEVFSQTTNKEEITG